MNIEIDVKIRVKDDKPEPRFLAILWDRIATHPCVVMIVQQLVKQS